MYSLHSLSKLFHFINILLYSELPRNPNKNSQNETNEKGSGVQYPQVRHCAVTPKIITNFWQK